MINPVGIRAGVFLGEQKLRGAARLYGGHATEEFGFLGRKYESCLIWVIVHGSMIAM